MEKGAQENLAMMVNHECRHIKTNGCKCESHALRGMPYCHFHDKVHRQRFARTQSGPAAPPLRLVFPEDRAGILLALDQVFDGLCTQAITARQATVLISGLRLASKNVEQGIFLSPSSSVETVSVTDAGHELGPEARPCTTCEDCSICPDRHLCMDYDANEPAAAGFCLFNILKPAAPQPKQNQQAAAQAPAPEKDQPAPENPQPAPAKSPTPAETRSPVTAETSHPAAVDKARPAVEESSPMTSEKKPPAAVKPQQTPPESLTLKSVRAVGRGFIPGTNPPKSPRASAPEACSSAQPIAPPPFQAAPKAHPAPPESATLESLRAVASAYPAPTPSRRLPPASALRAARAPRRLIRLRKICLGKARSVRARLLACPERSRRVPIGSAKRVGL